MEFTHRTYERGQTIAAIATPPGDGGVAIVRISGKKAILVGEQIFSKNLKTAQSHRAYFGNIVNDVQEVIDQGLAIVFRAPRSYTGEETVELHCHGGRLITQKVLLAALKAGARIALPGEFTYQAFLNGKIDLTQAEAVQQVIASESEAAWQAAETQLDGALSEKIKHFQSALLEQTAILEAWVDFPEEDLEFASAQTITADLKKIVKEIEILLSTFSDGRRLNATFSLCLLGAPNAGKSSLMNALTGYSRSIVTDIAGTTRDLLSEQIQLAGLPFRLIDTAGLRETEEVIEKEGVRRSLEAGKAADLILLVLDITHPILPNNICLKNALVVWNKIDLKHVQPLPFSFKEELFVSAKTKEGLDMLKNAIKNRVWQGKFPQKGEIILTNNRHFQALKNAAQSLQTVIEGMQNDLSPEFLVSDMRVALKELGTVIGINVTEEVLSKIFSKFCVGK